MLGKRDRVANLLDRCAVLEPFGRMRSLLQGDVPILAYHRVCELEDERSFPFDPELVSATPAMFRWQMEYVARHFDPISFADLGAALDGGVPLPARPILVTFDDGYLDNYTEAFPILLDTGVPATIFVATGYLGNEELFWYERVAYGLYRTPELDVQVGGMPTRLDLSNRPARRAAAVGVVEYLKSIPDAQRRELLARLAAQVDLRVQPEDLAHCRPMNWEHVVEMDAAGIEFGSHTVSHPVLSQLDASNLVDELVVSRRQLQQALGTAPEVIAYPFGGPHDFNEQVIAAVADAGYRMAASYIAGRNDRCAMARFELRRLHVERYTSASMFASMLAVPQLFAS